MAVPYEVMGLVFDSWTQNDPPGYDRWTSFIDDEFAAHDLHRILDIGCGTGAMMSRLIARGYEVHGVDASPTMVAAARSKLGPEVPVYEVCMPACSDALRSGFDGAISCFDAMNYLPTLEALEATIAEVARCLRSGAVFIFDVNTPHKFEHFFAAHRSGDDFADFGYIWRNEPEPQQRITEFHISIYVQEGEMYRRHVELHVERWHEEHEIHAALDTAGFEVLGVFDDYSRTPVSETTLRATWVTQLR